MNKEETTSRPIKRRKEGRGTMADRFFPNEMPDFVEERESTASTGSSLIRLLSLPYPQLSAKLLKAGLDLKEKVFPPFLLVKLTVYTFFCVGVYKTDIQLQRTNTINFQRKKDIGELDIKLPSLIFKLSGWKP
jgi:hypothetical protein